MFVSNLTFENLSFCKRSWEEISLKRDPTERESKVQYSRVPLESAWISKRGTSAAEEVREERVS
jgi:hypothetical protein